MSSRSRRSSARRSDVGTGAEDIILKVKREFSPATPNEPIPDATLMSWLLPVTTRNQAYRDLTAKLRDAKSGNEADELSLLFSCLLDVVDFLDTDPHVKAERLTKPFGQLLGAMRDVMGGGKPDLFFGQPKHGRPTNVSFDLVKATSAAAIDALMHWGDERQDAGEFIAAKLKELGINAPDGKPISARRALDWRDSIGRNASSLMTKEYRLVRSKWDQTPGAWMCDRDRRRHFADGSLRALAGMGFSGKGPVFPG